MPGVVESYKAGVWLRLARHVSIIVLMATGTFTNVEAAEPVQPSRNAALQIADGGSATAPSKEAIECHVGTYKLRDDKIVDIAPIDDTRLRWRLSDGRTGEILRNASGAWQSTYGWTGRPDGVAVSFGPCDAATINFAGSNGHRMTFDVTETSFAGHNGVKLQGRLILPIGKSAVPIVVLTHGAERDSALRFYFLQRMFPASGIGAFVYDKRGTGLSSGTYTQDFDVLADDAVAAMRTARRLAGKRAARIGYQGGSQAGWIIPLAANRAPVDFAVISFGLAVSVLEEDLQQMEMELTDKGYSPSVIAQAQEISRAAGAVFASRFTSGFREFDRVRERYRAESWYKDVHGHFTWALLPHDEAALRAMAPEYNWGTPLRYDPMPALRAAQTPQLWILGGRDYEAPAKETSRRISTLIDQGKRFALAIYPQAEHGMTYFETAASGERLSTRYPEGYFAMMRDFIASGRLRSSYGDAKLKER